MVPTVPASSLRRTLLRWLILPLVALVPLSAAVVYALAVRPALDGLDRALTDTAVALTGILEVHDGQPTLPLSAQTLRALRADLVDEVAFVVGDASGDQSGDEPVKLSRRECDILQYLMLKAGRVVQREQLVTLVPGWSGATSDNALDLLVSRLRTKIEPAGVRLRTVRGLGYLLDAGDDA